MAIIPQNPNLTKHKLDSITLPRNRGKSVPMSRIGDPCRRRLWFSFHWVGPVEDLTLRLNNLFNTGTRAEDFMVEDLERIGIKVTNRQEELWGFANHAHGFTDGRCANVPEAPKTEHLLEMKTHNDKNFSKLQKEGVKRGFPIHYAQVQIYMKRTKLTRCLYIGYNKNNSEYYIERIRYDASFANDLVIKEREVILSPDAPKREFEASWYDCKFCDFNGICYGNQQVQKNCRTCRYVDLCDNGVWQCGHDPTNTPIPLEVQETGCHLYQPIEIER